MNVYSVVKKILELLKKSSKRHDKKIIEYRGECDESDYLNTILIGSFSLGISISQLFNDKISFGICLLCGGIISYLITKHIGKQRVFRFLILLVYGAILIPGLIDILKNM